jgi:hypothetical protein
VLGRQVLGEVPALLFFLVAALLWYDSLESRRVQHLLGCGLFVGLAMLTKPQYLIIMPPVLVSVWLAVSLSAKTISWRNLLLPMVTGLTCVALWYACQLAVLGLPEFLDHVSVLRSGSSVTMAVLSPAQALQNVRSLFGPHLFKLQALALGYAILALVRNREWSGESLFLLTFVAAWLSWFVFVSVGWIRYAFPLFAIGSIFLAKLFFDLSGGFAIAFTPRERKQLQGRTTTLLRSLSAIILLAMIILVSLQHRLGAVALRQDGTPLQFAEFLNIYVNPEEVIESTEWELAFLTNHRYHLPSTAIHYRLVARTYLGSSYSVTDYDFATDSPKYLAVGEFAKWTGLYPADYLRDECTLVTSVGYYDLYEVKRDE